MNTKMLVGSGVELNIKAMRAVVLTWCFQMTDVSSKILVRCFMKLAEAEKNFSNLVNKVYSEGISVDLENEDKILARLTPAEPSSLLTVGGLNSFLSGLPRLGDDADEFAKDIRKIRTEAPPEENPWD